MIWADGTSYTGDWVKGRMQGRGTLKNAEGEVLIGMFKDNQFIGREVKNAHPMRTPKKKQRYSN